MAGKNKDEKDPKDIMANLPDRFTDDDSSDLGQGGSDDPDGDDGLNDDIDEEKGEEVIDGQDDADDEDDGDADSDLDDDGDADDDTEEEKPKPGQSEDQQLLEGEKLTKLSGGEYISKKSFLKRLKKESEGRKALQGQLDAAKPLLERKADFEAFEKNRPVYEQQNTFLERQRLVLDQDPFLSQLLQDKMTGKPTNWAVMTQHLKPFLAPFWDGVETVTPEPQEQALLVARQTQERLDRWERERNQAEKQQKEQALSQQRQEKHITTFAEQEKQVWAKHKAYATEPVYKEMLLDAAEAAQEKLPEGQLVNLATIADRVFGNLDKIAAKKRQERQEARDRAKLAGGERSGGLPGTIKKKADANATPLEPRQQVKQTMLERFGKSFG